MPRAISTKKSWANTDTMYLLVAHRGFQKIIFKLRLEVGIPIGGITDLLLDRDYLIEKCHERKSPLPAWLSDSKSKENRFIDKTVQSIKKSFALGDNFENAIKAYILYHEIWPVPPNYQININSFDKTEKLSVDIFGPLTTAEEHEMMKNIRRIGAKYIPSMFTRKHKVRRNLKRDLEVLRMTFAGKSDAEIATNLFPEDAEMSDKELSKLDRNARRKVEKARERIKEEIINRFPVDINF